MRSESSSSVNLAELTTLGVGGPARELVTARSESELIEALVCVDSINVPLLVLGGGSNVVVADRGFDGVAVRVANVGIEDIGADIGPGSQRIRVQAGEPWDAFVAHTVSRSLSGLEALSGIPGSSGATPVQNVGAYGADVSQTIAVVRVWDRKESAVVELAPGQLQFDYRWSILKGESLNGAPRYIVLSVDFDLENSELSAPIRYEELARSLGVDVGGKAPVSQVRAAVVHLRSGKGMVLDPNDRDTFSTGSFFTNPILSRDRARNLPDGAPRFPQDDAVKTSAAWLISHAGFERGFGGQLTEGRASLSTKHSLAITNRGGATASDVLTVARAVRAGVEAEFGVTLEAEPVLVGESL